MPTMRKRKQFEAQVLSLKGTAVSGCFVIADIETTVVGSSRQVSWRGRITSLSEPQQTLDGPYLLQTGSGEQPVRIKVTHGAEDRLGITSDEYEFVGQDAPPELP